MTEVDTEFNAWAEEYYNDIYNSPKKFGLEAVGTLDLAEPFYSFDLLLVSRHLETGKFYVNTDSGCSCPSPFDGVTLDKAGAPLDAHQTVKKVREIYNARYDQDYTADVEGLVSKIMSY